MKTTLDKVLTIKEQRKRLAYLKVLSANAEAKLLTLVDDIKVGGNIHKLSEFQQLIQYAHPETKERILNHINQQYQGAPQ